MREQFITESPDMVGMVARLLRFNQPPLSTPPAPVFQAPALIALPTQQDIDEPTTLEAKAMVAIASHKLAAIVERRSGIQTTAAEVYDEARGLLTIALLTYRRVSERDKDGTR